MESLTGKTNPVGIEGLPQLLEEARGLLFTNFPIYDESHRFELENLIMGRFLTREIAFTPFAHWKFKFNQKLAEIMPMYNELYKMTYEINNLKDPYDDTNYVRSLETNRNRHSVTDRDRTSNSTNNQVFDSNSTTDTDGTFTPGTTSIHTSTTTPQTELDSFLSGKYVSSADKEYMEGVDSTFNHTSTKGNGNQSNTETGTQAEDVDVNENEGVKTGETFKGKRGGKSYIELMIQRRKEIINIDEMILNELEELFFMVY